MLEQIMLQLPYYSQIAMSLVVVASLIVRITPTDKDDVLVDSFKNKLLKVLSWLPTFGVNPRTKALEVALKELIENKKE